MRRACTYSSRARRASSAAVSSRNSSRPATTSGRSSATPRGTTRPRAWRSSGVTCWIRRRWPALSRESTPPTTSSTRWAPAGLRRTGPPRRPELRRRRGRHRSRPCRLPRRSRRGSGRPLPAPPLAPRSRGRPRRRGVRPDDAARRGHRRRRQRELRPGDPAHRPPPRDGGAEVGANALSADSSAGRGRLPGRRPRRARERRRDVRGRRPRGTLLPGDAGAHGEAAGRRLFVVPVPVLSPTLSTYWVDLVTDVPRSVAHPLIHGLKNPVVVSDDSIRDVVDVELTPFDEAARAAPRRLRGTCR